MNSFGEIFTGCELSEFCIKFLKESLASCSSSLTACFCIFIFFSFSAALCRSLLVSSHDSLSISWISAWIFDIAIHSVLYLIRILKKNPCNGELTSGGASIRHQIPSKDLHCQLITSGDNTVKVIFGSFPDQLHPGDTIQLPLSASIVNRDIDYWGAFFV